MNFSEKLVFVRAVLNFTQAELAKQLDVSYPTINRWENGHVQPTRRAAVKFEQFCIDRGISFPTNNQTPSVLKKHKVKYGR